jgi:hypothetical protein
MQPQSYRRNKLYVDDDQSLGKLELNFVLIDERFISLMVLSEFFGFSCPTGFRWSDLNDN